MITLLCRFGGVVRRRFAADETGTLLGSGMVQFDSSTAAVEAVRRLCGVRLPGNRRLTACQYAGGVEGTEEFDVAGH